MSRLRVRSLGALASGVALALLVRGTASAQESPAGQGASSYGVMDWINIGLRLGVVLLVIWGAFVLMKWYVRRMNGERGSSTHHLQIVETRTLGPNRSLALVRVGGRAVLIGVTAERITQLMEIDDAAEVEELMQPPTTPQGRSLRSLVNQLPGSLMKMATPSTRQERTDAREPKARARFGGFASTIGGLLQRVSGIDQRPPPPRPQQAPRAARPAPQQANNAPPAPRAPVPLPADGGLFDSTPDASRALRAQSGYGNTARSGSRDTQIGELQRAIAAARSGLGLDDPDGRPGR